MNNIGRLKIIVAKIHMVQTNLGRRKRRESLSLRGCRTAIKRSIRNTKVMKISKVKMSMVKYSIKIHSNGLLNNL